MHNPDDDVWHVQLPSGEVCMMTLDLLDDAFQDGLVHEGSLVWQEGNAEWRTLGEVAGLDDDSAAEPTYAGASYSATAYAMTSYTPMGFGTSSEPPPSMGPLSTAPVAADIDDMDFEVEAASLRPRRRTGLRSIAVLALLAVAGIGVAKRASIVSALHLPAGARDFSRATGAMIAVPPAPPPVAAPPVVTAPPTAATPVAAPESRLSDDTKRALEEADKKLAAKQRQKHEQLQTRTVDRPKPRLKSDNPFHKGGNKFDPLNANL